MTQPDADHPETLAVAERYARRQSGDRYSILRPEVILSTQEWQRQMLFMMRTVCGFTGADLQRLRLVDVGCGHGGHLLDFLRIGFAPENLLGIELLDDRASVARHRVPAAVTIHQGDAGMAELAPASRDIVFQSVVFSSLLDDRFQAALADRMWSWLRPGGGIFWYDFVYNNPSNRDVRAVPLRRVRELFPLGRFTTRRVTLAPPIARQVCRVQPLLYHVCNVVPMARTHLLAWIGKPAV